MKTRHFGVEGRWLYPVAFAATFCVCCLVLLTTIQFFQERLPAPHFSINPSFNEKIRWLKSHDAKGCDILILGSSMGLNNIDGLYIENAFPGAAVVNAGSWGMSIGDLNKMLSVVLSRCTPKLIVFAVYVGDFTKDWSKNIDWNEVEKYLSTSGGVLWAYLENMDLVYYAKNFHWQQFSKSNYPNTKYTALNFDRTGGVLLEGNGFEIDPRRWGEYKTFSFGSVDSNKEELQSFQKIQEAATNIGAKVIVVSTPMRSVARVALDKPNVRELWEAVRVIVAKGNNVFIDANQLDLDDSNFTDFAHLNRVGAAKVSSAVVVAASSLPTLSIYETHASRSRSRPRHP